MAIEVIENGNIFESSAKYITNAVNCIGIMGAGIAKQFADRYTDMYEEYKKLCKLNCYEVGKPRIWYSSLNGEKNIINFPTMKYPGSKSKIEDIRNGLIFLRNRLKQDYEHDNFPISVAFCALGCGVGGLNSNDVLKCIKEVFEKDYWIDIEYYAPLK